MKITFFSGVLKPEPCLSSLQAYGTDGEEALVNALEACFPKVVGLQCFLHKQTNLESRLSSVSSSAKMKIIHEPENHLI